MRFPWLMLFLLFLDFFLSTVATAEPTQVMVSTSTAYLNETATVEIGCSPTEPIKAWEFMVSFNPMILQADTVTLGRFFGTYSTFFSSGVIDNTNGTITKLYALILGQGNITTSGQLVYINFTTKGIGEAVVTLSGVGLCNETRYLPIAVINGSVLVSEREPPVSDWSVFLTGWNRFFGCASSVTTDTGWNTFTVITSTSHQVTGWNTFQNKRTSEPPHYTPPPKDESNHIDLMDVFIPIIMVLFIIGMIIKMLG